MELCLPPAPSPGGGGGGGESEKPPPADEEWVAAALRVHRVARGALLCHLVPAAPAREPAAEQAARAGG